MAKQDLLIGDTNYNIAHNASLTQAEFIALHGDKFENENAAKQAHKDIKAAAGQAEEPAAPKA